MPILQGSSRRERRQRVVRVRIAVEDGGGKTWEWGSDFSSELIEVIRASKNPVIIREFFSLMADSALGAIMNPNVIPPGVQAPMTIR